MAVQSSAKSLANNVQKGPLLTLHGNIGIPPRTSQAGSIVMEDGEFFGGMVKFHGGGKWIKEKHTLLATYPTRRVESTAQRAGQLI